MTDKATNGNGSNHWGAAIHTGEDKRAELADIATHVENGNTVAIGGGLSSREPMAVIRELIRKGVKDLNVVGSAHGIDIDLLCSGGCVSESSESYVGFEQDFGMAPNYRRACESGQVKVNDSCCYTVVQQLRATIMGLPFMPVRSIRGTSVFDMHPEYKTMTCPYTGEELTLVPAVQPDVAIIHAQYGDAHGNLRIEGPPVADILFAKASKKVIASVEEVVSNERLQELGGPNIPYFYVTALAEVPMGAHPTACYPFYAYDRPHTKTYYDAAKQGAEVFKSEYLDRFVYGCDSHEAYLNAIGGEDTARQLGSWKDGDKAWMELYGGVPA